MMDDNSINANATCKFKAKKKLEVIEFVGKNWWKIKYNDCIGYVIEPDLLMSDDVVQIKKSKLKQIETTYRRNDSIRLARKIEFKNQQIADEKRMDSLKKNILSYVNDSLLIVNVRKDTKIKNKPSLFGSVIETTKVDKKAILLEYFDEYFKICIDSLCGYVKHFDINTIGLEHPTITSPLLKEYKKVKKEEREKQLVSEAIEKKNAERNKFLNECSYSIDERDEFTSRIRKKTIYYKIDEYKIGTTKIGVAETQIRLRRYGSSKYVEIKSYRDLGCVSPYSTNKSYVKFKLENGDIITFYHKGDIDCGSFDLLGVLTENDIKRLKKSPIKTVRLSGTKYYHDISDLFFKDFFIKKLNCIK